MNQSCRIDQFDSGAAEQPKPAAALITGWTLAFVTGPAAIEHPIAWLRMPFTSVTSVLRSIDGATAEYQGGVARAGIRLMLRM